MKNILKLSYLLLLTINIISCSSSSPATPPVATTIDTIFENGVIFPVGINSGANEYTVTSFLADTGTNAKTQRGFQIIKPSIPPGVIDIRIFYPSTVTNFSGTYVVGSNYSDGTPKINVVNSDFLSFYGTDDLNTIGNGSVKITDNGGNNYKIEFNNLFLKGLNGSTTTKTFTGFIDTHFTQH